MLTVAGVCFGVPKLPRDIYAVTSVHEQVGLEGSVLVALVALQRRNM